MSGGGFEPAERDSELDAALAAVGDFERGRVAYEPCAVCHGADGRGRADGTFPSIAGQHASVVIKQLVDMRDGNRENHLMLAYAQRLVGPQEIADVAVYVSALPRLSGNGVGEGTQLELGASLYREGCAGCHGGAAGGDAGNRVPVLAGQHYGYMLRQIRDIGAGRRRNAHPAMVALTAQYSDAELRSLVDYVSRLRALASDDSVREARP